MKASDIRSAYLDFYKARGHTVIPSAPLVPENDPTTLFISAGMQPLIQNILGEPHPAGTRVVNSQKSVRMQDIEEVGDNRHITFFEMLGNWSFGDYFKKEQLPWIFEFLTEKLGLDPKRLYISVFEGNTSVPRDTESIDRWQEIFRSVGIAAKITDTKAWDGKAGARIYLYDASKNWWSRSGEPEKMPPGEPGGPDSEVFFDFGEQLKLHEHSPFRNTPCHPNCDCGRFLEIANSVFMQFRKIADGSLAELPHKNVDFGGGLERMTAVTNDDPDIFMTDLFTPMIQSMEAASGKTYGKDIGETRAMRIITDHIKAAVVICGDGVLPSNKTQGYVLRRLIRRALLYGRTIGLGKDLSYVGKLVPAVADIYKESYPSIFDQAQVIEAVIQEEAIRFGKTLERGLSEIAKTAELDGKKAFYFYESYGFPWEMTEEIALQRGQNVDKQEFEKEFQKHKDLSRTAAKGMFAGGLSDRSQQTTKLHTAHHILLAVLQKVVDPAIRQRGSNITAERLRMDMNFTRKFTPEERENVSAMVNMIISENLPVLRVEMPRNKAEKIGAQMEFGHKYPDQVSVYFIGLKPDIVPEDAKPGDYFSAEFCGGPHVAFTGVLGHFTIMKEEALGAGVRRLYATAA